MSRLQLVKSSFLKDGGDGDDLVSHSWTANRVTPRPKTAGARVFPSQNCGPWPGEVAMNDPTGRSLRGSAALLGTCQDSAPAAPSPSSLLGGPTSTTARVLTGRRSPPARVRLTPRAAPPHLPARAPERHLGPRFEVAFEAEHLRRLSHLRGPAGGGAAGGGPGGLGGARQGRGLAVPRRPACGSALSALPAGASAATLEAGLSALLPPRRATAERGAPRLAPAPRCRRNQDGDRLHCARGPGNVRGPVIDSSALLPAAPASVSAGASHQ